MQVLRMVLMAWLMSAGVAFAEQSLPDPEGQVLLTVSGAIGRFNGDGIARFDRAMLDQLPQHAMATVTPWTEGEQRFEGPLLSDLLGAVESSGRSLHLRALNDFFAQLELDEVEDYPLMLVMRINGQIISVREKGPIWLLYPLSQFPELDTPQNRDRMVWQLASIEVRE